MEKKVITLDLTGCKYLGELHERIRVAFDFPEWYGANLDAFWDLLWSECDADEVVLIGVNTMPDELIIKDNADLKKKLSERIEKIVRGKAKMLTIDEAFEEIDSL